MGSSLTCCNDTHYLPGRYWVCGWVGRSVINQMRPESQHPAKLPSSSIHISLFYLHTPWLCFLVVEIFISQHLTCASTLLHRFQCSLIIIVPLLFLPREKSRLLPRSRCLRNPTRTPLERRSQGLSYHNPLSTDRSRSRMAINPVQPQALAIFKILLSSIVVPHGPLPVAISAFFPTATK